MYCNKTEQSAEKKDAPANNDDDFQEEEKEIQELTNQKLIARLVGKYRRATGMKSKDDFPRIGHLYLEFNYNKHIHLTKKQCPASPSPLGEWVRGLSFACICVMIVQGDNYAIKKNQMESV